ncbi:hypothetical protein D8674_005701 [Pyrus ussuriensis x Pyrus communis]|uniref:Uncharacterized protein n=1 Tax=Pyrus ussuriensis x Pyrus communis TaxID=2448454 RepID=A0A5N5G5W4_9ROSA|nr:hypothetical protein D8674_005701 [Pyrus ussuriensis x Pyrus communis]
MNQQPNKHQRWKVVVRTPELRLYALSDKAVGGGTKWEHIRSKVKSIKSDHRWEGKKVKRVDAWRGKYSGEDNMETAKRSFPIGARSGSN